MNKGVDEGIKSDFFCMILVLWVRFHVSNGLGYHRHVMELTAGFLI
jgi:hypothetical protein